MTPVIDRGKPTGIRVTNFKHLGKIEELFESGRVKSMIKMNVSRETSGGLQGVSRNSFENTMDLFQDGGYIQGQFSQTWTLGN